jgi:hypothetical protein
MTFHMRIFRKYVEKIQVSLTYNKNDCYLYNDIYGTVPEFFLESETFQRKFVEKIETYILRSITVFSKIV